MAQQAVTGISRLIAEADKIQDPAIREFTQLVLCVSAEGNWRGISGYNHHLQDERGEWGNLIHTLRVLTIVNVLCDLLNLLQRDRDVLRSAAILHDSCKHGVDAEYEKILSWTHPQLVAELVSRAGIEYLQPVKECIEQHTGRWGSVPCNWAGAMVLAGAIGNITLPFLLHVADCIESNLPDVMGVKIE